MRCDWTTGANEGACVAKFSRQRSRQRATFVAVVERELPQSLSVGGFLLFMAGLGTVGITVYAVVGFLRGLETIDGVLTWGMAARGYTWPLGVPMMALGPVSLVAGFRLMRNGPRLPALLASLGWLALDWLWYLQTGREFALGFWILSLPFILWGTLIETRRLGFRAALAA